MQTIVTIFWLVFAFMAGFVACIIGVGIFAFLASGMKVVELWRRKNGEV